MDYFMWIDKDDTFEGRRMEAKLAVQLGLFDSTALFLSFFFLIHHCFGRFVSIRFEFSHPPSLYISSFLGLAALVLCVRINALDPRFYSLKS